MVTLPAKVISEPSSVSVIVIVPDDESLTSTLPENVAPLLWVMVRPERACDAPTLPETEIVLLVPDVIVKVRSLLDALSASMVLLKLIPPVAVILILSASVAAPVTVKTPVPKFTVCVVFELRS